MSHRSHFLLHVAPCLLNCVAMFLVAFTAAFGGPQRVLLWPALALLAGGVLLLAAISAMRASEVGHSPAVAFFSVVLSATLGPAILVPITYLAFKPEVKAGLQAPTALSTWLQPFALLVLPWVVLVFFGLGRLR